MFAKKFLLPMVLLQLLVSVELSVTVHISHLIMVRVGLFPASLAERWRFTLTCRLLSVIPFYFFFPKLWISSKSLPCLTSQEATLYGGCHVVSFQANDQLIHSSVVSWLFSFVSSSLFEKIIFSLCVCVCVNLYTFKNHWSSKMQTLQRLCKGKFFVPFTFLDKMYSCCQHFYCWFWEAGFLKAMLVLH